MLQSQQQQKNSIGSIVLILILIGLFVGGYYYYSTRTSLPNLSTIAQRSSVGSHSVVTEIQPLNAAQIDGILCAASSPACHTGSSLYQDSVAAKISDSYALAVFKVESDYGTAGVARSTRSLGNIICTSGYNCYDGFRAYASWEAGYQDWFQLIEKVYVQQNLTTVEQITPKYAPSPVNNVPAYIISVNTAMLSWEK